MESTTGCKRIVFVAYPYEGHMTPMLQLASILHSKGFSIIIAHTKFKSPNPSNYPEFTFLPLSDNLGGFDTSFYNSGNLIDIINTTCETSFEDCMVEILKEEEVFGEVVCIIYDMIMHFVDVVARRLEIPTINFRHSLAAYMYSNVAILELHADKVIPLSSSSSEFSLGDVVPEFHPLRFKDLPLSVTEEISQGPLGFIRSYSDIRSSLAIIWNTTDILEHSELHQLKQHWKNVVPFFYVGPINIMSALKPTSQLEEDMSCLSWLDKQAPNSVIYVSFGSIVELDQKEINEIAWGLAKSEQPFLWVVRPSLLINGGSEAGVDYLPNDFVELTKNRGCIVNWAPQKKVLKHTSVGGFLSHCGWNSVLESMCEGVPMICRPCFGDHPVIARYLSHVWKVGLELEEEESTIEEAVRKVIVGEEGKEMRQRAVNIKRELEDSVKEGGSSYQSVEDLVEFIVSLNRKN